MLNMFGKKYVARIRVIKINLVTGIKQKCDSSIMYREFNGKPLQLFIEPSIQRATASKMWFVWVSWKEVGTEHRNVGLSWMFYGANTASISAVLIIVWKWIFGHRKVGYSQWSKPIARRAGWWRIGLYSKDTEIQNVRLIIQLNNYCTYRIATMNVESDFNDKEIILQKHIEAKVCTALRLKATYRSAIISIWTHMELAKWSVRVVQSKCNSKRLAIS